MSKKFYRIAIICFIFMIVSGCNHTNEPIYYGYSKRIIGSDIEEAKSSVVIGLDYDVVASRITDSVLRTREVSEVNAFVCKDAILVAFLTPLPDVRKVANDVSKQVIQASPPNYPVFVSEKNEVFQEIQQIVKEAKQTNMSREELMNAIQQIVKERQVR